MIVVLIGVHEFIQRISQIKSSLVLQVKIDLFLIKEILIRFILDFVGTSQSLEIVALVFYIIGGLLLIVGLFQRSMGLFFFGSSMSMFVTSKYRKIQTLINESYSSCIFIINCWFICWKRSKYSWRLFIVCLVDRYNSIDNINHFSYLINCFIILYSSQSFENQFKSKVKDFLWKKKKNSFFSI